MVKLFRRISLINARTVDLERPDSAANTWKSSVSRGSATPLSQGGRQCHGAAQFWVSTHPLMLDQIWRGITHGKGACFYGVSHAPIPSGRARTQRSPIWRLSSLLYMSQNYHILRGKLVTYLEEGHVSWGQPRLLPQESGVPILGVLPYLCCTF